ncbi:MULTISPECIES: hypothetical protein [Bacteria]|uniref:Uncharacterized protein n=3 Tax=Bacteria TaxID=2 RepID=A0ABU2AKA4_9ACTN|nr:MULTISPECIES: hypothetical protein [Bacteria]MDN3564382.1 hypothetical protein [Paeniroseomonas aquatica]MDR7336867.1 hypothetical protein [Glycomyces lechevalierae]
MNEHPKVTEDQARNAELVAAYDDTDDTGPVFTDRIQSLGYAPPERPEVTQWGFCVIVDDDGREWLAWDAEGVRYAESH